LATTRRWRLQLSRVDQRNSLNRRAGWPLTLLASSAVTSSAAPAVLGDLFEIAGQHPDEIVDLDTHVLAE
jgi:hypothetical protein